MKSILLAHLLLPLMAIQLVQLNDHDGHPSYQTTDFGDSLQAEVDAQLPAMPFTMPRPLMDMQAHLLRSTHSFSDKYITSLYKRFNHQKQQAQQFLGLYSDDISVAQMINATLAKQNRHYQGDLQALVQKELLKSTVQQPINLRFRQIEESEYPHLLEKDEEASTEEFTALKVKSVWASSVLTGKTTTYEPKTRKVKEVVFYKYPASDSLEGGKKYWCSTGKHSPEDVVTFQIDLPELRQVHYLFITWAYAPGKVAVMVSSDGDNFSMLNDFQEAAQGSDWRQLASKFWHWKEHYQSFVQHIDMNGVYVKSIKLLLKEPFFKYFGIYQIEVMTKTVGAMFRMKAEGGQEDCLIVGDKLAKYNDLAPIMVMNCIEALEMLESREVFFLETDWKISTGQNRQNCLMAYDNLSTPDTPVVVASCGDQWYKQWVVNHKGQIQLKVKDSMCMQAVASEEIANLALNQETESSSDSADGNHPASMCVDGSPSTYWASATGDQKAYIKVTLDSLQTIRRIVIKWKQGPKSFWVKVMTGYDQWEQVFNSKKQGMNDKVVDIKVVAMRAKQVWIQMMDPLEKEQFAIDDIEIRSDMKQVFLKLCDDNKFTNRFIIDQSDFVDISVKEKLIEARQELAKQGNELDKQVLGNIELLKSQKLQKVFNKGKELKQRMQALEDKLAGLDTKLTEYRQSFDETVKLLEPEKENTKKRGESGLVGTSSSKPGVDCNTILAVLTHKVSGFYWVQGKCSHVPLRVYCDFSNGGGFYAYLGGIREGDDYRSVVRNAEDVRFKCAQIGLEPLDIISDNQLSLLQRYILSLGIIMKKEIIPVAYDYKCTQGKCGGRFKSLVSETAADVTTEVESLLDHDNIANMDFSRESYPYIDGIGFAQNKALMQYFMFGQHVVKGVLCSDNAFHAKKHFGQVEADCGTIVRGNPDFDGSLNSKVKVICPKGCLKHQGRVWGSLMYKDDSSVCRAAIHAGQLDAQLGGQIEVGIEKGVNGYTTQYKGTESNQVVSLSYSSKWDRSFLVNKFVLVCPIDAFKARLKSSFIQTSSDESLASQALLDAQTQSETWAQDQSQLQASDDQSTDLAVKELFALYQQERKYLKKYLKMQQDAKDLSSELNKLVAGIKGTDISGQALSERIAMNLKHLQGTGAIQEIQLKDALSRTQLTYRLLQLTKLKKLALRKWFAYSENYEYLLNDVYSIYDNPNSRNLPSRWSIDKSNNKGHTDAIMQTSNVKCEPPDQCTASLLLLKQKEFYDGQLELSLFLRDSGLCGIVFRAKDEFNFYVFELSQRDGFKRIRKVVSGVSTTLRQDDDGGYNQDVWYRIKIIMKQGVFKIFMAEETMEVPPEIIHFEDQQLVQGRVGLLSNDMTGLYVDSLKIGPLQCIHEPTRSLMLYQPPHCSRFLETYFGHLNLRWKPIDPKDAEAGPSLWKIAPNMFNKDRVISQGAKVFSAGSEQTPTLLELAHIYRSCRNGFVSFEFFGVDDGAVGVALKFQNTDNYYLLEFHGTKKKQVTFKKKLDGRIILLAQDDQAGYEANKWHTVQIYMTGPNFRIFVNIPDESPVAVFPDGVSDEDFKDGGLALSSFRTRAAFDGVTMKPIPDLPTEEEEEDSPVAQEIEAIKVKEAGGAKKAEVFENENVKKLSWPKCLEYKTLKERQQHCKSMFDFDQNALDNCNAHYCTTCCEKEIDVLHKVKRLTCRKECNQMGREEPMGKPWQGCVTSIKPKNSVYSYCKDNFQEEGDQEECAVGFCDLCCINSEKIWVLSFDDKVMEECHQECRHVYGTKAEQEGVLV